MAPAAAQEPSPTSGSWRRTSASPAAEPLAKRLNKADKHLCEADPKLRRMIDAQGPIDPDKDRRASRPDAYETLARAIVGQQLSTKAAASIWGKVHAMFGGKTPKPKQVSEAEPQQLRDAGLSWGKVAYFRDLAERIDDGELDVSSLDQLDDEQVIEELTAVNGIGRWTAEMFLIFSLGRPDVMPVGDLGIRRGAQLAYGMRSCPSPTSSSAWPSPGAHTARSPASTSGAHFTTSR